MAGTVILDRRLYLNADKDKLVEDGHPGAAFLFGTKGKKVRSDDAERVGYKPDPEVTKADKAVANAVEADKEKAEEDLEKAKAAGKPKNKRAKATANK